MLRCCRIESISFRSGCLRWSLSISPHLSRVETDELRRTDIRKPATRKSAIERPAQHHSSTPTSNTASDTQEFVDYTEPVSDDEEAEDNRFQSVAKDEASWTNLPHGAAAEAKAFRDKNVDANQSVAKKGPTTVKEIFTKLTPGNLSRLLNSKYDMDRNRGMNEPEGENAGEMNEAGFTLKPGRIEYVSSFRAQPGKRIAIPVRIEPKVFFANERTSQSSRFSLVYRTDSSCSAVMARILCRRRCYWTRNSLVR